jgi:AbrB family looped-hinge helix DNA binding protein
MLATLTSKGQLTLPKPLREQLHLKPGDRVEFVITEDGRVEMQPVTASVTRLKGMVPPPQRPVSLEEMDAAVRKAAAHRNPPGTARSPERTA